MASVKKYKCPYCEKRVERDKMSPHIGKYHIDVIPEGFTINRLAFNIVNKKDKGYCVECREEVEWNEDNKRYNRYCSEKCKKIARDKAKSNMMKIYNKEHLLDDPEVQIKMLKNRSISGVYIYSDGREFNYVGSLEKSCLEYLDKVLNMPSSDIMTDYPILKYNLDNKERYYIPDFYIIPLNLIIEVKDGGDHKNGNPAMEETRRKTIAKEDAVKNMKKYNYIRLVDNNFDQLIKCINEIKNNFITDEKHSDKMVHSINEETLLSNYANKIILNASNRKKEF